MVGNSEDGNKNRINAFAGICSLLFSTGAFYLLASLGTSFPLHSFSLVDYSTAVSFRVWVILFSSCSFGVAASTSIFHRIKPKTHNKNAVSRQKVFILNFILAFIAVSIAGWLGPLILLLLSILSLILATIYILLGALFRNIKNVIEGMIFISFFALISSLTFLDASVMRGVLAVVAVFIITAIVPAFAYGMHPELQSIQDADSSTIASESQNTSSSTNTSVSESQDTDSLTNTSAPEGTVEADLSKNKYTYSPHNYHRGIGNTDFRRYYYKFSTNTGFFSNEYILHIVKRRKLIAVEKPNGELIGFSGWKSESMVSRYHNESLGDVSEEADKIVPGKPKVSLDYDRDTATPTSDEHFRGIKFELKNDTIVAPDNIQSVKNVFSELEGINISSDADFWYSSSV